MRIQIDCKGIGGRNEDWWYLVFDEGAGMFLIEHEWHDVGDEPSSGITSMTMAEAKEKDKPRYDKAVRVISERLFHL